MGPNHQLGKHSERVEGPTLVSDVCELLDKAMHDFQLTEVHFNARVLGLGLGRHSGSYID